MIKKISRDKTYSKLLISSVTLKKSVEYEDSIIYPSEYRLNRSSKFGNWRYLCVDKTDDERLRFSFFCKNSYSMLRRLKHFKRLIFRKTYNPCRLWEEAAYEESVDLSRADIFEKVSCSTHYENFILIQYVFSKRYEKAFNLIFGEKPGSDRDKYFNNALIEIYLEIEE